MKILYIERCNKLCNYYSDIIKYLKLQYDVKLIYKDIDKNIINYKPDIIIYGFGISDNYNLNIDCKCIPLYIILNKEYSNLKLKLEWIKLVNPVKVFTVHHNYNKYYNITGIPFHRIMWSADSELFKKYTKDYKYDLFFSGIIRDEQTDNLRKRIYDKLYLINNYNLLIKVGFFNNNKIVGEHNTFSNNEYALNINYSKISLTTTGPADLVGTRYFEIMASNKSLILCNKMNKDVYADILIDEFNCIMFNDENDFMVKFKYYIEHEDERNKIVNNAYNYFLEKHTWKHKINDLLNLIK